MDYLKQVLYLGGPYTYKQGTSERRKRIMYLRYRVLTILSVLHPALKEYSVISPVTQSHVQAEEDGCETTWEYWANTDLALLKKSDAMVVVKIPNWRDSIGLQAEIAAAKMLPNLELSEIIVVRSKRENLRADEFHYEVSRYLYPLDSIRATNRCATGYVFSDCFIPASEISLNLELFLKELYEYAEEDIYTP